MTLGMSGVSFTKLDRVAPLIPDPLFATPSLYKMITLSQAYILHEGLFTNYVSNPKGRRGLEDSDNQCKNGE